MHCDFRFVTIPVIAQGLRSRNRINLLTARQSLSLILIVTMVSITLTMTMTKTMTMTMTMTKIGFRDSSDEQRCSLFVLKKGYTKIAPPVQVV